MRKKLFAVIMSAMMMITFMPTMAFAAYTPDSSGDYASLTGVEHIDKIEYASDFNTATAYCKATKDGKLVDVTVPGYVDPAETTHAAKFSGTTGKMTVTLTFAGNGYYAGTVEKSFINLDGVKVVGGAEKIDADKLVEYEAAAKVMKSGSIPAHFIKTKNPLGDKLRFVNPKNSNSYADVAIDTLTSSDAYNGATGVQDVLYVYIQPTGYEPYDEGEYEFPLTILPKNYNVEIASSDSNFDRTNIDTGKVTDKSLGVMGTAPTSQKATVKAGENFATLTAKVNEATAQPINTAFVTSYTGENVKFELQAKGYTAKYQLVDFSGKTTEFSETFPEFKNVGTYVVKAEITKNVGTTATKTFQMQIKVNPLDVKLGPAKKLASVGTAFQVEQFRKGDTLTNADLVSLVANTTAYKNLLAKSDVETWKKIAENYVTVDEFDSSIDSDYQYVTAKLDKAKLAKDTDKDIEQFLDNYTIGSASVDLVLDFVAGYNDVTTIAQTKTFHVKNAKALKSKKTFKLKNDVADWGALSYIKLSGNSKITVSKTGKVTVKKGLKKGKYTVKIKVKAPGAKATKKLTVKVVK